MSTENKSNELSSEQIAIIHDRERQWAEDVPKLKEAFDAFAKKYYPFVIGFTIVHYDNQWMLLHPCHDGELFTNPNRSMGFDKR